MRRFILTVFASGLFSVATLAASPKLDALSDTPEQTYSAALRASIGAPFRADLSDQATERLADGTLFVPHDPAIKLLAMATKPVPPNFIALLLGPDGIEAPGFIRFVPAGFIDSDAALAWTADDFLFSLKETIESGNPDRLKNNLQEREARRWVRPPRYNPETHQLSWAAMVLPKSAPRESDGEVTFHAVGFGREGIVEHSIATSEQKAEATGRLIDSFLGGLNFVAGKAYHDAQSGDRRAAGGVAEAMGLLSLRKAEQSSTLFGADPIVPIAGGIVAAIGALSLFVYIAKNMRREARRG